MIVDDPSSSASNPFFYVNVYYGVWKGAFPFLSKVQWDSYV